MMKEFCALDILKHPQSGDDSDIIEAIECAIKALEKQIPKKVEEYIPKLYKARCPSCNAYIRASANEVYCFNCGQALDWSENDA